MVDGPTRPSDVATRAVDLCLEAVSTQADAINRREEVFAELDGILERASDEQIRQILSCGRYRAVRQLVYHTRAEYEYEREMLLAQDIVETGSEHPAAAFRSADWYDRATEFEMRALASYRPKRMLFVGAGPFPTSPFSYMRIDPEVSVTCLDRHESAGDIAREVAAIFGFDHFDAISSDILDFTGFADFDCVIIGLVVGTNDAEKARIAEHLKRWVPPDILLALRTAVGSGAVIYPEFDLSSFDGSKPRLLANPPHKSFTLAILERDRAAP